MPTVGYHAAVAKPTVLGTITYGHDDERDPSNQYVEDQQEQYDCCIIKSWAVLERDRSLIDTLCGALWIETDPSHREGMTHFVHTTVRL